MNYTFDLAKKIAMAVFVFSFDVDVVRWKKSIPHSNNIIFYFFFE